MGRVGLCVESVFSIMCYSNVSTGCGAVALQFVCLCVCLYRLWYCGLTVRSCSSLASALRSNPSSLRVLHLGVNNLQQSDVELLSALQKDPKYNLTELQ